MAESTPKEFLGTGRRKTAVARVRLAEGAGKITVNGRGFEKYFGIETLRMHAAAPLEAVELSDKTDIRVNVRGGGPTGQAGAIRLGIARALERYNSELRPVLKERGFMTRDPRKKERKKPGQPGARKRFQYSKR